MCTVTAAVIGAVAGSLWQGYSSQQQAKAQARAEEQQTVNADRNAQNMAQRAEENAQNVARETEQKRRQMLARAHSQTAAVGASGIQGTGSALNVLSQNYANVDYEPATNLYNGRQQTEQYLNQQTNYNNEANQHRQKASDYRAAGRNAMLTGFVNAITGATSIAASNYTGKSAATQAGKGGTIGTRYKFDNDIMTFGKPKKTYF